MTPTFFHIPASERDDFVVVPICDCKSFVYVLDGRSIPTVVSGIEVAGAIVNDHIKASIYVTDSAFPGIKSLPGNHSKENVKKMFGRELEALNQAQKNWFGNLVKAADDVWTDPLARGKQYSISDTMRYAAKYLGLNRDWLTAVVVNNIECFACGYNVPDTALICLNCKTVLKPEELAKRSSISVEAVKKAQPVSVEK
jgi:hypothetical protein